MSKSLIIVKEKGAIPPLDFLRKAIGERNWFSISTVEKEQLVITKRRIESAEKLHTLLGFNKYKDVQCLVCLDELSEIEEGVPNSQPHKVFQDDYVGYVFAAAGALNLRVFQDDAGINTPAYQMATKLVKELFKRCSFTMSSIEIIDDEFVRLVLDLARTDEDCLIIMSSFNEVLISTTPGYMCVQEDWGWVSEDIGMYVDDRHNDTYATELKVEGDAAMAMATWEEKPEQAPVTIHREEVKEQIGMFGIPVKTTHGQLDEIAFSKEILDEAEAEEAFAKGDNVIRLPGSRRYTVDQIKELYDVINYIGGNGQDIPNPKIIKELTKPVLSFEQESGATLEDFSKWPREQMELFVEKVDKRIVADAILMLQQQNIQQHEIIERNQERIDRGKRLERSEFPDHEGREHAKVA